MNNQQIAKIVEMLENARKRPNMYTGRVDVYLTVAWMHGFEAGILMFADNELSAFRQKVLYKRKWKPTNVHYSAQMRERGMTPEAIVDEILVIEIEVWKRVAKQQRLTEKQNTKVAIAAGAAQADSIQDTGQ